MLGTMAAPSPAATRANTPAISPPSRATDGSNPASWHTRRVMARRS